MTLLKTIIALFMVLETLNIIMLYFTPGTRRGNGMGAFSAYEKAKKDPEVFRMVQYLVNWVAGTKLIFLLLLLVILIFADQRTQFFALIALILSVSTFFWRLYPIIKSLDADGLVIPKGYSRTLAMMIGGFLFVFVATAIVSMVISGSPA